MVGGLFLLSFSNGVAYGFVFDVRALPKSRAVELLERGCR